MEKGWTQDERGPKHSVKVGRGYEEADAGEKNERDVGRKIETKAHLDTKTQVYNFFAAIRQKRTLLC